MKRFILIAATMLLVTTAAMAAFTNSYYNMNWSSQSFDRDYIPNPLKLWMIEAETKINKVDAGTSTVHIDTITLEPNDIKALYTTPKTLVAAPGAHNVIEFVGATFLYDYATAAYANAGNNMTIKYTDGSGAAVSGTLSGTGFLTATADTVAKVIPVAVAATAATGIENKPLVLAMASADPNGGAGGAAAGVVRVKITYIIHPSGF